jgi:hypothetical protein
MPHYWVVTPEFSYTEPVLDDGSGPTYDVRDVVEVEAPTARDAVRIGVKRMLSEWEFRDGWCNIQRQSDACPYAGVRAELKEEGA